MSGFWMVVVPVAAAALIVLVLAVRCLAHPLGGHRADRARLDGAPDLLATLRGRLGPSGFDPWAATVPVAQVAGEPPWLPAPEYRGPASLGTWFPHDDYSGGFDGAGDRYDPFGTERIEAWVRDGMQVNWIADTDLGPGAGLFLSPGYNSRPAQSHITRMKADSPAPAGLPREDGAGDESEGSGLTAPSAPPCCDDPYGTHAVEAWAAGGFVITWDGQPEPAPGPAHPALERCDWFIAHMKADHERWLASARERWAA